MRASVPSWLVQAARRLGLSGGDAALVRRAALVVAVQTGAAVAVVVAVVSLLALSLTMNAQELDIKAILRQAASTARTVDRPPPGVWLVLRGPDGHLSTSPGAPPELSSLDIDKLRTGSGEREAEHGHDYAVYTADRDGSRMVAVLDLRYRRQESERLVAALAAASACGIGCAAIVGWLIARRAVRPLGSALELQRRFVADASHELRTPLTILHTRAQLLQSRGTADPKVREGLDRLVVDARALTEIVNDLLLSAELAGRPGARQPVELARLAADVAESFAPAASGARIELRVDAPEEVIVAGVPVALRRAVAALVDNALGHNHPGGSVTVAVRRDDRTATVTVADDGDGLDPAEVPGLTERFARGSAAKGQGRRFGMGLALVREVVQAHEGSLALDGRPGHGATVTIRLPLVRPATPQPKGQAPSRGGG